MATIYLKHPLHGGKVCCTDQEANHDRLNGWRDFDPYENVPSSLPSFMGGVAPATPLPPGFPGIEALAEAGLTTMESIDGKTSEELQAIPGIGKVTAVKILDAQ